MGKSKKDKSNSKYSPNKELEIINLIAEGLDTQLTDEEYDVIGEYYVNQAPRKLYKYRSGLEDRDIQALISNKMWFSTCKMFNDPFECTPNTNYFQLIDKLLRENEEVKQGYIGLSKLEQVTLIKKFLEEQKNTNIMDIENFKNGIAVSCLSSRKDSILMWGHYANSHKGICIEYDILELAEKTRKTYIPVKYSNEMPHMTGLGEHDVYRYILELIRTKAKDWEYECEWRCVQDEAACGNNWTNEGALLDVSPATAIYLGSGANELVEPLKEICSHTLHIPLYQMKVGKEEYKLIPERIL